jgi:hypothetical protein
VLRRFASAILIESRQIGEVVIAKCRNGLPPRLFSPRPAQVPATA